MILIALQSMNSDFINGVLVSVGKLDNNRLPGDEILFLTFVILSFVLFVKYTQSCFFINMCYKYLNLIESELNKEFVGTKLFTFEGEFYKSSNSFYRTMISFFYKIVFPIIIILFIISIMIYNFYRLKYYDIYYIINTTVFFIYIIYLFVYIFKK